MIKVGLTRGAVAKEEVVETDDDFAVGSEAKCEAIPSLEDWTGECLLSHSDGGGRGGEAQRVGNEMWLLDTDASGHFTHDWTKLVGYPKCNIILRYAGGAVYPSLGTGLLEIHPQSAGGVATARLLEVGHCQAFLTTECRCD